MSFLKFQTNYFAMSLKSLKLVNDTTLSEFELGLFVDNTLKYHITRKSSCVNARGIPPAA